jgi:hypothetical protein
MDTPASEPRAPPVRRYAGGSGADVRWLHYWLACDTLHVQPSWLDVHEAKVHYDASANL